MSFELGNSNGSPSEFTSSISTDDAEITINKGVSLKAALSISSSYAQVTVKGLFKEFGYGNPFTNSYFSIAEMDVYLSSRFSDWPGSLTDEQKEFHALNGMEFVERNFSFKYEKLKEDQGLSFPRSYNFGSYVIPQKLKNACMEASYLSFKAKIVPYENTSSSSNVTEVKNKVGPLETVTKYEGGANLDQNSKSASSYKYIENLLSEFISSNSGTFANSFDVSY